jgi:hypothetical protein
MATTVAQSRKTLRKALLICGILASPLYVGTDFVAGTLYPGYSFTSQYVSELFAIGAPTSSLVVPLFVVYSVLLAAFGLGVWVSAGRNRALRITALMVVGNAVNGLALWPFFPMHMRGVEATFTDTIHNDLAITGVIFVLLALGFSAVAYANWFRPYSVATILILLVPGILAFLYGSHVGANLPTPGVGIAERISTGAYLLWVAVLAVVLLRAEKGTGTGQQSGIT